MGDLQDSNATGRGGTSRRQALKILGGSLLGMVATSVGCLGVKSGREEVVAPVAPSVVERGQLTYRTWPRSGDKISLLGFGTMRFPTLPDPQDPSKTIIDEVHAYELIDYAWSHGVNYFDTAHFYHNGMSEVMLGKALKRYPRDSFYIADKMPTPLDPNREQIEEIFEGQLKKCQVEYFDYYLLHTLKTMELTKRVYMEEGGLAYLLEQKKKGRIRNLGWSFHGTREVFNYALDEMGVDWDFVQIQLNYNDWLNGDSRFDDSPPAKWMYEELTKRNIPVIVMEPLLGGRLAKLPRKAIELFKAFSPEDSVASWAFRFAGQFPNIMTVLSGMTYMEHLQDNLKTFSPLKELTPKENDVLNEALKCFREYQTVPCTACQYCMPCPYGVNIPAIFSHYNKYVTQSRLPINDQDPEYARYRREYLIDYARAVNPLQQADRCIYCRKCVDHCPQNIAIPKELGKIRNFIDKLGRKL